MSSDSAEYPETHCSEPFPIGDIHLLGRVLRSVSRLFTMNNSPYRAHLAGLTQTELAGAVENVTREVMGRLRTAHDMVAVARGFRPDGSLEEDLEESFRVYFHQSLTEVFKAWYPLPASSDSDDKFIEALTDALSDDIPQAQTSRVAPPCIPTQPRGQTTSNTQAVPGNHSTPPRQPSPHHPPPIRPRPHPSIRASQGPPVQELIPGTAEYELELPSADEGSSGDEAADEGSGEQSGEEESGDEALSPSPVVYVSKRQM